MAILVRLLQQSEQILYVSKIYKLSFFCSINTDLTVKSYSPSLATGLSDYVTENTVIKSGNLVNLVFRLEAGAVTSQTIAAGYSTNLYTLDSEYLPYVDYETELAIRDGSIKAYFSISADTGIANLYFREETDIRYLTVKIDITYIAGS